MTTPQGDTTTLPHEKFGPGASFKTRDCSEFFLIYLNRAARGASALQGWPGNDLPPSATPAFSCARRRTGDALRPDQRFCEVISLTDLGRCTRRYDGCGNGGSALSAHLAGARFYGPARLSVPHHRRAPGRPPVPPRLRQRCGWDSTGELPSEPPSRRWLKPGALPMPSEVVRAGLSRLEPVWKLARSAA